MREGRVLLLRDAGESDRDQAVCRSQGVLGEGLLTASVTSEETWATEIVFPKVTQKEVLRVLGLLCSSLSLWKLPIHPGHT